MTEPVIYPTVRELLERLEQDSAVKREDGPCEGHQGTVGEPMRKLRSSDLVYFLPSLHLIGCLISLLTRDFEFIIKADLPISLVFVGLAYSGVSPVIGFVVFGTLWWYLLSLVLRSVIGAITRCFTPSDH